MRERTFETVTETKRQSTTRRKSETPSAERKWAQNSPNVVVTNRKRMKREEGKMCVASVAERDCSRR